MTRCDPSTRPSVAGVARALLAAIVTACAVLGTSTAWAQTCSVTAVTHAFGAYNTLTPKSGTSSISVTCISGGVDTAAYDIFLSSGPGTYAARQMTGTGDILTYNLYTDAAHTTVWGDGSGATSFISRDLAIPASGTATQIETVYGLIGAPQNVTPGAYSASPITVTVAF